MKILRCLQFAGLVTLLPAFCIVSRAATISNNWSGVAGDRGNMTGFAFRADAGSFPASVDPAGSLTPNISLNSLTFFRPNDTTTPSFGTGTRQVTDANTPVFLDVYSTLSSGVFSGYLGSSSTSVAWANTVQDQAYSFAFAGLTLSSSTKYWFVFSEDNLAGDDANFRVKLNTSGNDTTPGEGKGYLVNDTVQGLTQGGANQDWGFAFTADFTPVPEPSIAALCLVAGACLLRRRRAR